MIDVFKIGVHIGMSTNSTQVLQAMMRHLMGIHMEAGKLEGRLGGLKGVAVALGAAFAAWEVGKVLIHAVEHAEKLNHELVKLQIGMRLNDSGTEAERLRAFEIARAVPGANVVDLVKQKRELAGTMGSLEHADQVAELVARGSVAVSNYVDKDTDLAKIAVRALEIRGQLSKDGKVDPAAFAKEFDMMVRAIVASEGLLKPENLLQFIQQAGPAARNMSPEAMWGEAPAVMNALGSSKAGTAMNSMFAQFIGHVVAGKRVAMAMEEAGMLTPGKWHTERGGKVRMDNDAVPDQKGFMKDPFEWMHEKLVAMRAKGTDPERMIQEIFQLGSRSTTQRLISDIDANWAIIQAEKARFNKMPSVAVIAKEQNDKDASVNIKAMHEAWDNFLTALGKPGIPIVIAVMHSLAEKINFFQKAIVEHPEAAEWLMKMGMTFLDIINPMQTFVNYLMKIPDAFNSVSNFLSNWHLPGFLGGGGGVPGSSPNVPWSGRTYGPNGNTNPDGTPKVMHPMGYSPDGAKPEKQSFIYNSPSENNSGNGVVRVAVVNSHDIGHAVSGGFASGLERQPSGPTDFDGRMSARQSNWGLA